MAGQATGAGRPGRRRYARGTRLSELEKVGEGREAEIFAVGDGTVLRLMREPGAAAIVEREASAIEAARSAGAPAPRVHELVTVDGRPGMIQDRVEGRDLLSEMNARPWSLARVARTLAELHGRLHEATAPESVPELRRVVRERIEGSPLVPGHLAEFALRELEALPGDDRLCHGDYHPGNVLRGSRGAVIIDWTAATRGDPAADVARTRLLLRVSALPPGAPALTRVLVRCGRAAFDRVYARAYAGARELDPTAVARWHPVLATERLSHDVDGERDGLVAIVERAMRA